jgi:hydrogenase expression/formation protein HypC
MCLAVPGKIIEVQDSDTPTSRMGMVDLQGSRLETNLAMVPEAGLGDWVLVHAGFAIQTLSEEEARETWEYLQAAFGDEAIEVDAPTGESGGVADGT